MTAQQPNTMSRPNAPKKPRVGDFVHIRSSGISRIIAVTETDVTIAGNKYRYSETWPIDRAKWSESLGCWQYDFTR